MLKLTTLKRLESSKLNKALSPKKRQAKANQIRFWRRKAVKDKAARENVKSHRWAHKRGG